MNIVEYFIRRYIQKKLDATNERLAALNELISSWEQFHTVGKPGVLPTYVVSDLAKWKSERAGLRVRKSSLERELQIEEETNRDV